LLIVPRLPRTHLEHAGYQRNAAGFECSSWIRALPLNFRQLMPGDGQIPSRWQFYSPTRRKSLSVCGLARKDGPKRACWLALCASGTVIAYDRAAFSMCKLPSMQPFLPDGSGSAPLRLMVESTSSPPPSIVASNAADFARLFRRGWIAGSSPAMTLRFWYGPGSAVHRQEALHRVRDTMQSDAL
jgi:hypothetical protein